MFGDAIRVHLRRAIRYAGYVQLESSGDLLFIAGAGVLALHSDRIDLFNPATRSWSLSDPELIPAILDELGRLVKLRNRVCDVVRGYGLSLREVKACSPGLYLLIQDRRLDGGVLLAWICPDSISLSPPGAKYHPDDIEEIIAAKLK